MKLHKVYVYGTLRQNKGPVVQVPGHLFDLGWFPGAKIYTPECDRYFKAEIIEVDDKKLSEIDHYEGYNKNDEANSLYLRRPYLDGWIYEYNHSPPLNSLIEHGDWARHKAERKRREG